MDKKPITHFLTGAITGGILILFSVILIITDQLQNQKRTGDVPNRYRWAHTP